MINWLSQSGEQEEVTRAIQALSSFLQAYLKPQGSHNRSAVRD